jgi:hypothetical protein
VSVAGPGRPEEPGLDRHDWEGAWASIQENAREDPDAALSQLADLAAEMLEANGYRVRDSVERSGDEPEAVVTYLSAREAAERAELGQASRGEVESALEDLRTIYEALVSASSP